MKNCYRLTAAAVCFICQAFQQERTLYTWAPTSPLETGRHNACAVPIAGNRILVAGGIGIGEAALPSVEIYQEDQTFQPAAPMAVARSHHACVLLSDGRVLVAGGRNGSFAIGSAEVFDPAENVWIETDNAPLPRSGQTATLLRDGKVLLAGGESDFSVSDELELFDPETNRFESLQTKLTSPRKRHAAAMIDDGWVLLIAGHDGKGELASSDYYDPLLREILGGPDLPGPRSGHTATALLSGDVLVAGGTDGRTELASTLLYAKPDYSWKAGPQLRQARQAHVALRIPNNGNVLIAGGSANGTAIASSELYQVDGEMTEVGALTLARLGLVMAAREDGVILAAGGLDANGPVNGCGNFIPPTITLNKARYLRSENIVLSGHNWPANKAFNLTFLGPVTSQPVGNFQTTAIGDIALTRANAAAPGPVTTVRVTTTNPSFSAETTYRTIVKTTTLLTLNPQSGGVYGNTVTLNAEVRPEEVNGQMGGIILFQRLVQVAPPPAPLIPQVFFVMSSAAPAPGTFGRNVNEFGFFGFPFIPPAGLYNFQALYPENDFYAGSISGPVNNYSIGKASATVSVTSSTQSPVAGNATSFVATVQSPSLSTGNGALRPTGTVRFTTSAGASIDATLDSGTPPKATAFVPLAAGSVNVTANYLGSGNHLTASATVTRTVQKSTIPPTAVSVDYTAGAMSGQCLIAVNCQVVFRMVSNPVPTGQVTMIPPAPNPPTPMVSNLSGGNTGFFAFQPATAGALDVSFSYQGDSNYNSTSYILPVSISLLPPTLRVFLGSSEILPGTTTPVARNAPISVLVGVVPPSFVNPSTLLPTTGTISLNDGVSAPTSLQLSGPIGSSGTSATFRRQYSSPGQVTLTFSYGGNPIYTPATATRTIIVN